MPYRLENGEPVRDGLRRCAGEELDSATEALVDGIEADPVEAIHEARKALKKERALLRLARATLDPQQRRQEADIFREAARRLSEARDADVMIKTLDDLAAGAPGTALAEVRRRLQARRDDERGGSDSAAAIAIELCAARRRVDSWKLRRGGWPAIGGGLGRSYRRGRHAFKLARSEPTPEHLHDWRKRVKDLWYHLRLLRALSEPTMRGQADEAHRLAELLGDDHDLHVLREALVEMADETDADLDPLLATIDRRRNALQTDAMLLGERVYAEHTKAFLRRIHRYWKAWRAEAGLARADHQGERRSGCSPLVCVHSKLRTGRQNQAGCVGAA